MYKFISSLMGFSVALSCVANNGLQSFKILFPTGVTKATKQVMKQASDIYNKLPERNFTRVRVIGLGEENQSNLVIIRMAKERAYSIRSFFIGMGCSEKNVKLDLTGMPNVILFKPKAKYSISGKLNLNKIKQQCFIIDPIKESSFETKGGSVFVFHPNSFETEYGFPVIKNIVICVWEFVKKTDMIFSQLSSSGKNKVLETASIFYIQGYKGDEKLQIKNNKSFKIYLNREEDSDRFKAYYGEVINGNVIWREDKKSYTFLSLLDEGGLPHFESKKENSFRVLKSANSINQPLRKTLLLSGKKMGWINCDRIVDIDVPSSLDILLDKVNEEFTVRLVLNNKNAIIPGLANSNSINHYKFSKVPEGENGYVLAYKEIRNGYMIAYSKVTIGFIKSINLEPEYKTKQEFEYLIDSFLN